MSAVATGVLASVAQAHPGHGETGWMHEHSTAIIALTVVAATVIIAGLVVARMANRGDLTSLRQLGDHIRRK